MSDSGEELDQMLSSLSSSAPASDSGDGSGFSDSGPARTPTPPVPETQADAARRSINSPDHSGQPITPPQPLMPVSQAETSNHDNISSSAATAVTAPFECTITASAVSETNATSPSGQTSNVQSGDGSVSPMPNFLGDETKPASPNASVQQLHAVPEQEQSGRINKTDNRNEGDAESVAVSKAAEHTLQPATKLTVKPATEPFEAQNTSAVDGARREDFQNTTGRSREASRAGSEVEGGQRRSVQADSHPPDKLPTVQEEAPGATQQQMNSTEMDDQTQPQPPQLSVWVKETADAARVTKRRDSLSQGDVLFVPDPLNPAKAFLLQSGVLFGASTVLQTICGASDAASWPRNGVAHLLMLEKSSGDSMPELHSESLDFSPPSPQPAQTPPSDGAAVKAEDGTAPTATMPSTRWPRAYESFFRITSGRAALVSKADPDVAMPQIEDIVTVAQYLEATYVIEGPFERLLPEYIRTRKLYPAISRAPLRYLNVAIALKNRLVFEEAFVHIVGASAKGDQEVELQDLPEEVRGNIIRKSRELRDLVNDAHMELMLLNISSDLSTDGDRRKTPVGRRDHPTTYCTVNLFQDWLKEHIGYVRLGSTKPPVESEHCAHTADCYTPAGFFRTLASAGDVYLPADRAVKDWPKDFKMKDHKSPDVKTALTMLKESSAVVAKPLVASSLQHAEDLDYLTCVTVEDEDVPWKVESGGSEDGDVEMED